MIFGKGAVMARGRRVKKIDNLLWGLGAGSSLGQSAGVIGIQFASVATSPHTIMRLRGEVMAYVDGAGAPTKLSRVTWGIIVVPEGTGSTVVWDPDSDSNAPWLAYGSAHIGHEEMVIDVVDVPGLSLKRWDVDNKAMRRVRPDEEIQIVFSNVTIGSASTVNFAFALRELRGF